jgi:hypothetical protein
MNKKVYLANLPFQAGEPELKAPFLQGWRGHVCKDCPGQANWPTEGYCLHGDVYTMGSPEGCFHAEPDRFNGEEFAGKRGDNQAWLPGEIAIRT